MSEAVLMTIILIMILSIVSVVFGVGLYLAWHVNYWPSTQGKIIHSEIEKQYDKKRNMPIYLPKIKYSYKVNSKDYVSTRIALFLYTTFVEKRGAKVYTEKYVDSKDVRVLFHPFIHSLSVLQVKNSSSKFPLQVGLALIMFLNITCISYLIQIYQ